MYVAMRITITDTMAIIGTYPKIVFVLLSHPVVFALKIRVKAIGSRIAASSTTTKISTSLLCAMFYLSSSWNVTIKTDKLLYKGMGIRLVMTMKQARKNFDRANCIMHTSTYTIEGNLSMDEDTEAIVLAPNLVTSAGMNELIKEFGGTFYSNAFGGFVLN